MKNHYVYRITNVIERKHYYGVRSTKMLPKDDLGKKYFSSSLDKDFKSDQKNNKQNYRYKVIKIFLTRKDAITHEIKLHNKFNVAVNENFYNRSKSSSTGFDRSGCKAPNFGKKASEATRKKISEGGKKNWHKKRINSIYGMQGKEHSEETKKKMSEVHKGILHSEETKKKMRKPKTKEHIEKLKNCKKFVKEITLFNDSNKEFMSFESITIFREYCSLNKIPYKKLMDSYYFNNSEPITNIREINKRKYNGYYIK